MLNEGIVGGWMGFNVWVFLVRFLDKLFGVRMIGWWWLNGGVIVV